MTDRNALLDAIADGRFVVAPGIQDMITAVIANKVGFEFVYAPGYWTAASAYGMPDAGLVTYSEFLDRIKVLVKTTNAHVIADADTGFGGLLNLNHTVKGYAAAGVTAIQIEDQVFPKRCGHTAGTRVIETAEMVTKIQVADEARRGSGMALIARTDARASKGLDDALERANAYAKAGADLIFVEALQSQDEMQAACASVSKPMMANMATGGKTPILKAAELEAIGYSAAIFPALTSLAAAAAVEQVLTSLKQQGDGSPNEVPVFDFAEFCDLIGFPEVHAFEDKWGR